MSLDPLRIPTRNFGPLTPLDPPVVPPTMTPTFISSNFSKNTPPEFAVPTPTDAVLDLHFCTHLKGNV